MGGRSDSQSGPGTVQVGFPELEVGVELPPGVFPATGIAGDAPSQSPDAKKDHPARRTGVGKPFCEPTRLEVEGVATIFLRNPEIVTGRPPLGSVRRDAFPPDPGKGDEMCEFVQESAAQLRLALLSRQVLESRIQLDPPVSRECPPRSGAHAGIPKHCDRCGEGLQPEIAGEFCRDESEHLIASRARVTPRPGRAPIGSSCLGSRHRFRPRPVRRSLRPALR